MSALVNYMIGLVDDTWLRVALTSTTTHADATRVIRSIDLVVLISTSRYQSAYGYVGYIRASKNKTVKAQIHVD